MNIKQILIRITIFAKFTKLYSLICRLLPAPTQPVWDRDEDGRQWPPPPSALVSTSPAAPPYGQRRGWVPRKQEACISIYS